MHATVRSTQHAARLVTLAMILPLAGCASWSYRAFELGQTPRDYEGALPRTYTRDTGDTLCYYEEKRGGKIEAIIVNVGDDRRVDGKWQAQRRVQKNWLGQETLVYGLRGEFDPTRVGMDQAGPADVLRLQLLTLTEWHDDPLVVMARGMIGTGIARLLETRPEVDLSDMAEDIDALHLLTSGGGTAKVDQDANGVYYFEYQESTPRGVKVPEPEPEPESDQ